MDMNAPGDDTAGIPTTPGGAPTAPGPSSGSAGSAGSSGSSGAWSQTPPGTPPPPQPVPSSTTGFFGAVRRLDVQRADDRWVGGVCAGLANRTGYDPLLWRGIFAASVLIGGIGFVLYGLAWALLPERRDGRIHTEELLAGRFDVAVLGALAFTVIGLGRGGGGFWFWGGEPRWIGGLFNALAGLLWLGFVAAVIVAIVVALNRRNAGRPPVPPGPYGPFPTQPTQPYATPTAAGPAGPAFTGQAYTGQAYAAQSYPTHASPAQSSSPLSQPAAAPYGPVPVVASSKPVKTPKPRTLGPGVATVGIVVALGLLTLAVLLAADRADTFTGPVVLTTIGIGVVLCGLGIVVSGFRGRSSGVLGFLAIVGIIVALPFGAASNSEWRWNENGLHRFAGDVNVHMSDRTEASEGFALGFGEAHVDLTDVPMSSDVLEVPISVGAGQVTVVVPQDAAVTADVRLRAGQVTWDVDGTAEQADGISTDTRTFTDDASADGSAQLNLQISVGAGDVTVIREDS